MTPSLGFKTETAPLQRSRFQHKNREALTTWRLL